LLKLAAASPFAAIARERWRELGGGAMPLAYDELAGLSGLGEPVAVDEVADVYVPLARLLSLRVEAAHALSAVQGEFLGEVHRVPFLVALGGSVAVGKSTAARLVVRLLASLRPEWRVELVTTDGFLLPNAALIERDILARKGFPESYDRRALLRFVADLKSGVPEVRAPVYSHLRYDIVEGEEQVVRAPDVLVLEGVNVLQRGSDRVYVSDFALYLDAEEDDSAGTSRASSRCATARSRTRTPTSIATRTCPTPRRSRSPPASGSGRTARTCSTTSSRRARAPTRSSRRARTTSCRACCCGARRVWGWITTSTGSSSARASAAASARCGSSRRATGSGCSSAGGALPTTSCRSRRGTCAGTGTRRGSG
jgi:type I pantothenate kinase